MPTMPFEGLDPEKPGSRFTWRPGLAVLAGEVSERRRGSGLTAEDVIEDVVGEWILEETELGKPKVIEGSIGRGAEGWAPVLEWVGLAAGSGIIGGLAWESVKTIARAASRTVEKLRQKGGGKPTVFVSRGWALLSAIDAILEKDSDAILSLEAVDEPSSFGEYPTPELNYVGIEPWVVLLVDLPAKKRWIVVVRPTGEIAGMIETPLEDYEDAYLRLEPLDVSKDR